ncbi:MAG: hypothetical protein WCJ30_17230 [Deltaproteobacteria bacterium]
MKVLCLVGASASISCAAAATQVAAARIARRCEVTHNLHDGDTVESRISRLDDGWTVSLSMSVRMTPESTPIEIRGLGLVTGAGEHRTCHVTDTSGDPGQPRFDADLCLDEVESVADLLDDAQQAARPGETVVQEVRLRASRRHRARSHVVRAASYRETAEITRDPQGRVIRVVRTTQAGGREELLVSYPSGVEGRCVPQN